MNNLQIIRNWVEMIEDSGDHNESANIIIQLIDQMITEEAAKVKLHEMPGMLPDVLMRSEKI